MESGLAATCSKTRSARRQLPITGSAHKTTIVADALVVTVIAALDMTTKCRSSTQFDRAHDATLCNA